MALEKMTPGNGADADSSQASSFADLVAFYLDRLNEGELLDPDVILADHPELGERVLEELRVFIHICPPDEHPLGTLGDYVLRRQIGRGGMGVVYEAWENSIGRSVALKVLPAGVAADRRATARFMREAQAAGQLNHENIVRVYSTGVREGTPWYSMEFVEGETLAQILARLKGAEPETDTPFGPKDQGDYFIRLARSFADVADGLQHAHSKGVIHRDIKPSNLILDQEDRLRILDFGLARLEGQESLTISGDIVGTPLYMSPEQARRKKIDVDHRTDVYSLGATMHEVICGRPPFRGKDHADTLSQIIERDPVEPRKVNPRVPKDLETVVLKCLRKDAGDRYGTAEALDQDLRRFARGDAIEARAQTGWERMAKRARKHKRLIAAATVLLVLTVVGAWVGMALIWKEQVKTKTALREVLRLSDVRLLTNYREEAETLWPCMPEKVAEMEAWMERAQALASRLPVHQRALVALRQNAFPFDGNAWRFENTELQWQHDTLEELVDGLRVLVDQDPVKGTIASVEKRLAFARSVYQRTIEDRKEAWKDAIRSIADPKECPEYKRLRMQPQVGLIPIGPDPDSGLWEFAHIQTGDPPERGADGKLILTEGTGLVFVLIPGGNFQMGAVRWSPGSLDSQPRENERPVHEVELATFFMSKYEMTQGQWLRFTGTNPSVFGPDRNHGDRRCDLLHPVEFVSWENCERELERLGLELPTEAQWEYACRAGTKTAWWTGNEREALKGRVNLADQAAAAAGEGQDNDDWLDDGYVFHAPVGTYPANPFGLHEVHGNVWEWCRDWYLSYDNPVKNMDGEREGRPRGSLDRVCRGGSYYHPARLARSTYRKSSTASFVRSYLGVRPACRIAAVTTR